MTPKKIDLSELLGEPGAYISYNPEQGHLYLNLKPYGAQATGLIKDGDVTIHRSEVGVLLGVLLDWRTEDVEVTGGTPDLPEQSD